MAKNDFLVFDESQTNSLTQSEYETDGQRIGGVISGLARSDLHNKALHQLSIMVAALGQVIADSGKDASDQDVILLTDQLKGLISGNESIIIGDDGTKYRWGIDNMGVYLEEVPEENEAMTEYDINRVIGGYEYDDVDGNPGAITNAEIDNMEAGGRYDDVDGNKGAITNQEIAQLTR